MAAGALTSTNTQPKGEGMRRLITTTICACALFFAVPIPAAAQTIGFKLGMTSSKFDVDPDEGDQERLNQFGGGGFIRFGFAGLALQLEALAVTKGTKVNLSDLGEDFDGEIKLDYIEVPLTAMFTFGNGPYIFAGPAIAFETGCSVEAEVDGGDEVSVDCDEDDADFFQRKSTDFGVTVGAGLQFAAGPGAILIEGRHTWGLTNINDDGTEDKVRNRAFAVFAGYAIPIGNR